MIYGEYAKTTGFMSAENLVEFLMKEQREKASLVNALKIIEGCEPDENGQCLRNRVWKIWEIFFLFRQPPTP